MEIKGDYNKGAVYNDTLIGHDKKYIWKKRNPGDRRWKATAPGGDTDKGVTLSWS